MQAKQEESKETIEQGACENPECVQEPPTGLQLHLVGHTHACTFFSLEPLSSLGSLDTGTPGVVGLGFAPPPFPHCTRSAEALPKFSQPPVVTRAR